MAAQSMKMHMSAWLTAIRLPFTTVAVVPFAIGIYLANVNAHEVSVRASLSGLLAVFLLCIGCYLTGEVYDQTEDRKTIAAGRTKFSGGTLTVVSGELGSGKVMTAASLCFAGAVLLGLYIFSIHHTLWLIGLGAFGALAAALYSLPPVRLVKRGLGELFIGICYGWLPLVTGYGCATGDMPPQSYLFCLPVVLSIFNVILLNEFPDYDPDRSSDKRNLLVRIGRERGAQVYASASILTAAAFLLLWYHYQPLSVAHLLLVLPAMILALFLAHQVLWARVWSSNLTIERVCGLTIVLNHLSSITIGALVRW
jgi:1,4-dihydroxy-2-naphthoate octaprenyltransferase